MVVFEPIRNRLIRFFEYVGEGVTMSVQALMLLFRLKVRLWLSLEQMALMGFNSLPIVSAVTVFTGMILSLQATRQAHMIGATQYVGGVVALVMARELGPVLAGVVLAGRVGSSIASELGSMKVSEQVDALRALAVNPVEYLVVPRLAACVIMTPIVSLVAGTLGVVAGYYVANAIAGVTYVYYMESIKQIITMSDVTYGLIKSVVFGGVVALVGCHEGMMTRGGAAGVGRATTASVVTSMVLIFAINYFLSAKMF